MGKHNLPAESFIWVNAYNPDVQDQIKRHKIDRNIQLTTVLEGQALMLFELMFMERYILNSYPDDRTYLYPFFLHIALPQVQGEYEAFRLEKGLGYTRTMRDKDRIEFERKLSEKLVSKYRYILQQEESRLCNT